MEGYKLHNYNIVVYETIGGEGERTQGKHKLSIISSAPESILLIRHGRVMLVICCDNAKGNAYINEDIMPLLMLTLLHNANLKVGIKKAVLDQGQSVEKEKKLKQQ